MRLYTSTADPIDLCRRCAAGLTDADDDGEMHYTCDDCGRPLTLRD